MSADLFTEGKFQAISSAGPVAGGLLYTYTATTLNPLATYTDYGAGTTNANPVVLDAEGRASVWLGPYVYRMILKTAAGVTIWDVDNIKSLAYQLAVVTSTIPTGPVCRRPSPG